MTHVPIGEPGLPTPSGVSPSPRLTLAELEYALGVADPTALLVLPRILRRVIKQHCEIAGFGLRVPHRKSYVIACEPLLQIVDKAELGLSEDSELPETVILLARPDPRKLAKTPAADMLIRCWRLLFHSRIHAALDDRMAEGELSALVRGRIRQIGPAEFEEIRQVLGQEDLLLPPRSDTSVYVEFVAVYLELQCFVGSSLPRFFPGLKDLDRVGALVRQEVDVESIFWSTRPEGAPLPHDRHVLDEPVDLPTELESRAADAATPVERPSRRKYRLLMRQSQRPASVGNVVRAAIFRARAERVAPPEFVGRVRSTIKMDVYRLIRRIQAALDLNEADPQPWQNSLFALVNQTPYGIWTAEERLLYDLQKVCVDHERGVYTVDLAEWILSRGRRPIKRELPYQRDVLMLKHLRSAAQRLAIVRLSDNERRQLALLVQEAMERVETKLRHELRPQIVAALDAVGLVGQNLPERVARKKLIEEMLDQIGERGFLSMGDLRDAISRNNLKLPDLSEPLDWLEGDQLLQADRKLSLLLDGVYRRGEFYLRWMQRVSSVGFGTRIGRFLTRFAIVPFGGAYVALAGVHHVWEMIVGAQPPELESAMVDPAGAARTMAEEGFHLTSPRLVLALGLFLLCLINSAAFRRGVVSFFKTSYQVLHAVVIEPIRWIVQSPFLQRILRSRPFTVLLRFIVKPLLGTGIALKLLPVDETNWHTSLGTAVSFFLAFNLALNSRLGRNVEEVLVDWIVQGWHRFGLRAITGLFWMIVDLFKAFLEAVERLMYGVDEWLRFKSGESRSTFVAKAVLGLLWFCLAYVVRFALNVLIEPQINPVKHFPVVTVSHKLLLPLIPSFAGVLENTMENALAWTVAATTIWCVPGVFGFLVWELKENWRLYAANRRRNLSPALIGSHGETMTRLLKPGFHSGTLPKRYAKLRRAERRAWSDGSWPAARKHLQALHHIEVSVRRYVEREFLELFAESRCWQGPPVTLDHVWLGTNTVRLAIGCPAIAEENLQISLEVEGGWLVGGVVSPGWVDRLRPQQRQVLATALLGLYRTAGAELLRQPIEGLFAPPAPWYGFSAQGLLLWPGDPDSDAEVLYHFNSGPWIAPQSVRGLAWRTLPTVERRQLVFADVPIPWDAWVLIWNQDLAGQDHPPESVVPVRVLPEKGLVLDES